MATRIRLRRVGRKKQPIYRIVVADKEAPRDGRFIETVGQYNPRAKDEGDVYSVKEERVKDWLSRGATPTDTVRSILQKAGIYRQG